MNLKQTISILFLFTLLTGCSQNKNDKAKSFEKKVNLFRYSLNKELDKINSEKLTKLDFNEKDSLIIQVNNFCNNNKKEIINYRLYKIQQYLDNAYDTTFQKYRKVPTSDLFNRFIKNQTNSTPLLKIYSIDPFDKMSFYETFYFSKEKNISEMIIHNTKKGISKPFIATQKMTDSIWKIYIDYYTQIFQFTYDINSGNIEKFEIYELKKQN